MSLNPLARLRPRCSMLSNARRACGPSPKISFFNAATNQLTNVSYDAAGNQTVFASFTIGYDAEGRQLSAQSAGSSTVTYAYDGLGERVTKTVAGGTTTTYVHDGFGNLAAEYTSGGTPPAPPCSTCYLSWDHLGSTRLMTDQNGNPVARHDYLPFGVEIPSGYAGRPGQWGTADNVSAKFTGQERDTETGLDFFQARYHGSAQARFLSPDPLGNFVASAADPQSWNMYAYARNNPLTLVDPTGLDYCDWGDGVLDDDPAIGGSTQAQCEEWGGTWFVPTINDTVDSTMGGQVTYTDPTLDEDALDPGFTFYATGTSTVGQPGAPQGAGRRLACAAEFGQNHSIAAAFGAQNNFLGNLFGGNTFSGLADLGQLVFGNKTPNASGGATIVLGGSRQGLPGGGPGSKGAAGQASDALVGGGVSAFYNSVRGVGQETLELGLASGKVATIVAPLAETTVGAIVGWASLGKLAFDAGTFAYGAIFACQ